MENKLEVTIKIEYIFLHTYIPREFEIGAKEIIQTIYISEGEAFSNTVDMIRITTNEVVIYEKTGIEAEADHAFNIGRGCFSASDYLFTIE